MAAVTEAITAKFGVDMTQFNRGMKKARQQTDASTKKMSASFGKMTKAIGVTTIAIGAALVVLRRLGQPLVQFQTRMAEVSTIVDTTTVNMRGLTEQVLALSRTVPQTADDLGAGLYQVFSSGVTDTAEAMSVLAVSSRAATAGLSTTFQAVDATTTVLNAYGLAASEAGKINDIFFETVKQGKITYDQIASSIGEVANSAALANVPLEEVAAAIATMTKSGINANETVTSLNRLLLSIVSPTAEASKAAKSLGVDWSIAGLEAQGFQGLLQQLNDVAGDNIEVLQSIVPEIRAFRAASVIAGKGAEEYTRQVENMGKATGSVDEAFVKMNNTFSVQWDLLANKLMASFATFSDPILKDLTMAMKGLNDELEKDAEDLSWWGSLLKIIWEDAVGVARATEKVTEAVEKLVKPSTLAGLSLMAANFKTITGQTIESSSGAIATNFKSIAKSMKSAGTEIAGTMAPTLKTIEEELATHVFDWNEINSEVHLFEDNLNRSRHGFEQMRDQSNAVRFNMRDIAVSMGLIATAATSGGGLGGFLKNIFTGLATFGVSLIPVVGPYLAPFAAQAANAFVGGGGEAGASAGQRAGGRVNDSFAPTPLPEQEFTAPSRNNTTNIRNVYLGESLLPPSSPDGIVMRRMIAGVVSDEQRKRRL